MKKLTNVSHKIAAFATTSALLMGSSEAYANTFDKVSGNLITSSGRVPQLISIAGYLIGAVFIVAGVLKLRQHVDNPGNAPLKDGLIRLGAGAALVATPALFNILRDSTVGSGGSAATFQAGFGNIGK